MSNNISINIDQKSIQEIVQANIQAAVTDVLAKNHPQLIAEVVSQALNEKPKDSYGRGETILAIEMRKAIRDEALLVFKDWIEKHRPEIRQKMVAALSSKAGPQKILDAFLTGLASKDFNFTLNIPVDRY